MDEKLDMDALLLMAQLEVTEQTKAALLADVERIVGFVDVLKGVDTENVEPLIHPSADAVTLRKDVSTEVLGRAALEKSPHFDGTYIRVPKVVE